MLNLERITKLVYHFYPRNSVSSLATGAGLAYIIESKRYEELPLMAIFPVTYAGYKAFRIYQGMPVAKREPPLSSSAIMERGLGMRR